MNFMNFATWNVRTILDHRDTNRPARRTALVTHELSRFDVDLAALKQGSGYTIFWKGKEPGQTHMHGVGFAIKTKLVKSLNLTPSCITGRIMSIRISLSISSFITIFSIYAPTLNAEDNIKEEFYHQLDQQLTAVPSSDKILLLGDFNARLGKNHQLWEKVVGKDGVRNSNANGHLLGLCSEHQLAVTNTFFRQRNRFKTTWQHPRSKYWHFLDYAITRQCDLKDVLITRSMLSAVSKCLCACV
uniref:Endonuclease/exonuclease/phosphatase domain-containing protein n=1 Tax=Octopus bimaculoides TaxID=37653 RepID=A0A0L8FSP9_OCTBM